MFSFLLGELCRGESGAGTYGRGTLLPPSSAQTEVQAENTWQEAQENAMISINKCSSVSSPVNVTFGYETEFCKIPFFKNIPPT